MVMKDTMNSVISNLCNVTHSLISWNLMERMFLVQISLLIATFLSLISRGFVITAHHHRGSTHTLALRRVPICGVSSSSSSSYATCWIVGAWICHIAREGRVEGWHVKDGACVMILYISHGIIYSKPWTQILNHVFSPLTCVTHLSTIQCTNVGSPSKSWICTGVCITHCEVTTYQSQMQPLPIMLSTYP